MQYNEIPNNIGIPCLTRAEMGPEIAERIRCTRLWCQRHWKLLCNPDLTSRSKFGLYKVFVRPILTYACELWDINEQESKKLLRFESSILVEIYKSKYPLRHPKRLKPNLRSVYKRFRDTDVVYHVNCERLRWTELLEFEETALRRLQECSSQTICWWDEPCLQTKKRRKRRSQQNTIGSTNSNNKQTNNEPKQASLKII